jgi:hypothetical protein
MEQLAQFSADPAMKPAVTVLIAAACIALIIVFFALVYVADRDRLRIEPTEFDFSNLPGFSRDQLERIARMPLPPVDQDPRAFTIHHTSPEVTLRSKRAGTVFHIPSGGAGVSTSGARHGS